MPWVMKTIGWPVAATILLSSSCMTSRVMRVDRGERLVHQQQRGSVASARARPTRCCMPPESSRGIGLLEAGEADHLDVLRDLARRVSASMPLHLEAEADIVAHRAPRQQRVVLEDDRAVGRGGPVTGLPYTVTSPAAGSTRPATTLRNVLLPQPLGPDDREELALAHLEVEVLEGDEPLAGAGHVVAHRQVAHRDERRSGCRSRTGFDGRRHGSTLFSTVTGASNSPTSPAGRPAPAASAAPRCRAARSARTTGRT